MLQVFQSGAWVASRKPMVPPFLPAAVLLLCGAAAVNERASFFDAEAPDEIYTCMLSHLE
jgi:hypothetical protein